MQDRIHPKRLTHSPRARLFAATALISGVLVAGCGGSSGSPPVATVNSTTTSTSSAASTGGGTTSRSSTATSSRAASAPPTSQAALVADALIYAKCMRRNGVPNFPDPDSGGGFTLPASINPSSAAFTAARATCGKVEPGFGGPGSGPAPSSQTLAHWVTVARCMRRHGISNFPDPRTSLPPPSSLGRVGVLSDRDGVILVFPRTLDMQSPLFARAAAACGFQLTNH